MTLQADKLRTTMKHFEDNPDEWKKVGMVHYGAGDRFLGSSIHRSAPGIRLADQRGPRAALNRVNCSGERAEESVC